MLFLKISDRTQSQVHFGRRKRSNNQERIAAGSWSLHMSGRGWYWRSL